MARTGPHAVAALLAVLALAACGVDGPEPRPSGSVPATAPASSPEAPAVVGPRSPEPIPSPSAAPEPGPTAITGPEDPLGSADDLAALAALAARFGCADVAAAETTPAHADLAATCTLDDAAVHLYAIPDDEAYVAFLRSTSSYPSSPPAHVRVGGVVVVATDPRGYDAIAAALG